MRRRGDLGRAAWLPALVALLAVAGCGRPLGSVFDGEGPPATWTPIVDPCTFWGGLQPDAAWPMLQRCPSHAGVSPALGPQEPRIAWSVPVQTAVEGVVIDAAGVVYGGGDAWHVFVARDPADGSERWRHTVPEDTSMFTGYPAIGADGAVAVPAVDRLVALSTTGEQLWALGTQQGLPVDPDDPPDPRGSRGAQGALLMAEGPLTYAVGLSDDWLLVIDGGGTILRSLTGAAFPDLHRVSPYPALDAGGKAIFSARLFDDDITVGGLTRVSPGGQASVLYRSEQGNLGVPVLTPDGDVLVIARSWNEDWGVLLGIRPDGEVGLRIEGVTRDELAPAVGADGTIYVAAGGGTAQWDSFRAYSPTGQLLWDVPLPGIPYTYPVVDGAGAVFLGGDAYVIALEQDGGLRWRIDLPGEAPRSLALDADGRLFVQTYTQLLAIGP